MHFVPISVQDVLLWYAGINLEKKSEVCIVVCDTFLSPAKPRYSPKRLLSWPREASN